MSEELVLESVVTITEPSGQKYSMTREAASAMAVWLQRAVDRVVALDGKEEERLGVGSSLWEYAGAADGGAAGMRRWDSK
jgi:hypothetical protein